MNMWYNTSTSTYKIKKPLASQQIKQKAKYKIGISLNYLLSFSTTKEIKSMGNLGTYLAKTTSPPSSLLLHENCACSGLLTLEDWELRYKLYIGLAVWRKPKFL